MVVFTLLKLIIGPGFERFLGKIGDSGVPESGHEHPILTIHHNPDFDCNLKLTKTPMIAPIPVYPQSSPTVYLQATNVD